jgi:hypothetical protein
MNTDKTNPQMTPMAADYFFKSVSAKSVKSADKNPCLSVSIRGLETV